MKILLLGGAGIFGRAVVKDLVSQKDVTEVMVADLNIKEAKRYARDLASDKVSFKEMDVSDYNNLVKIMKGFDVVGNCVYWKFLIPITKAAIESKVHVVDAGGFFYETKKQMELDGSANKSGITILSCCGSGPGINNVLARYGADKLDKVDEINIWAGAAVPSAGSPSPKGTGMTIRSILDEYTINPVIFENGEFKQVPLFSGKETIRFSEPLGVQTTYFCIHTEPLTIAKFIPGVKRVTFKIARSEEEISKLKPLNDLGLTSEIPIKLKGEETSARQLLDRILLHYEQRTEQRGREWCGSKLTVSGVKDNVSMKISYDFLVEHDKRWGNTKTGVPFAIGLLMLGRGEISKKGFTAPEQCINPVDFIAELKKREFIIKETKETLQII